MVIARSEKLSDTSPPSSHAPSAHRRRWRISISIALLILSVLALVFVKSFATRQLTSQERLLIGAWEWQGKPGMVLYFDDRGILTYSQPPFTTFVFERWHIDDDQRIHLTSDGKDIIRTVRRMVDPQTEVYAIRFSNGTPILKMPDGTEKVLAPYTGIATETLKDAR